MVDMMNDIHRNEISEEIDILLARLAPLKKGYPVALMLDNPKGFGKKRNPLLTLTPGILFGFRSNLVVVSVINNGSCIVQADSEKIADLILAGLPAQSARILMDRLNKLYSE